MKYLTTPRSLAPLRCLKNEGIATAAIMATMAITILSSITVNPWLRFIVLTPSYAFSKYGANDASIDFAAQFLLQSARIQLF